MKKIVKLGSLLMLTCVFTFMSTIGIDAATVSYIKDQQKVGYGSPQKANDFTGGYIQTEITGTSNELVNATVKFSIINSGTGDVKALSDVTVNFDLSTLKDKYTFSLISSNPSAEGTNMGADGTLDWYVGDVGIGETKTFEYSLTYIAGKTYSNKQEYVANVIEMTYTVDGSPGNIAEMTKADGCLPYFNISYSGSGSDTPSSSKKPSSNPETGLFTNLLIVGTVAGCAVIGIVSAKKKNKFKRI